MRVVLDDDSCRGHGICCTICPEVFTLTDEGYAVVELAEVPPEFQDAVRRATQNCPERAITAS